ncbi:Ethylene-overproduction protein 1 [Linum grandiflorum]
MQPILRSLKFIETCKSSHLYALKSSTGAGSSSSGAGSGRPGHSRGSSVSERILSHIQEFRCTTSKTSRNITPPPAAAVAVENLMPCGLPETDLLEPRIEPDLKPLDLVETLADLYRRIESCPEEDRSTVYLEQWTVFRGLSDPKMLRRSLRAARQHAVDVHSKVVLGSWLRFERREDEFTDKSAMDCFGRNMECPRACLEAGYDPDSANNPCRCRGSGVSIAWDEDEEEECSTSDEDADMAFCIGEEEIRCARYKFASLSKPFRAMLYGDFMESRREKIYFSLNGISAEGMKAAEVFSRTKRLHYFDLPIVLELLCFANRFCCEEMKSACDAHLASHVSDMDLALLLVEYGLEETAYLLVAACLQVFLRELPSSMHNSYVMNLFCTSEGKEKLAAVGHDSFMLYYLLSQIAMEDDMNANSTVMLLERLCESASEIWQKQIAYHQIGVVMLERKEYKDAHRWFEAAAGAGHVYSLLGVARTKYKRGHKYAAYKVMNALISDHKPAAAWMYQERAMYGSGKEKLLDLDMATALDPSLTFPYRYRAVSMVEDGKLEAAISELNKVIGFHVSSDLLELRAWISIGLRDYEGALRDVRALLTLETNYMLYNRKIHGDQLVELLIPLVQEWDEAYCWHQLYDRWSCVDDIGSLAVIHQMLTLDSEKSSFWFRQSILLLRLNAQKAAMRCLRLARNLSPTKHEMLVYEGWILYDSGHREEALAKAEESLSIQRSFEAFFLKAYILVDRGVDPESSEDVIRLLNETQNCPSDRLRKGQAMNTLGDVYVDCKELDLATYCYNQALDLRHTRAHQGLARVYKKTIDRKAAYDEMTKLIEIASNNASAYEKRAEYCDIDMAKSDLAMTTQLNPLRPYPYRYRAAVLMDDRKEAEAIAELTKAITFKPDVGLLCNRAAFYESTGNITATLRDCQAALCFDPCHGDTMEVYIRARERRNQQQLSDEQSDGEH